MSRVPRPPSPSLPGLVGVVLPVGALPSPRTVLERLLGWPRPFLRLGSAGPTDLAGWSYAGCDPVETLDLARAGPGADDPFDRLGRRWPRPVRRSGPRLPFGGGWVVSIGYEARAAVEATPAARRPPFGFPTLSAARYDAVLAWDHRERRAYVAGLGARRSDALRAARRLLRRALRAAERAPRTPHAAPRGAGGSGGRRQAATPRPTRSPAAYRTAVAAVRARIRAGDLFQANLSQRFDAPLRAHPFDLFVALARTSPAPFLTYLDVGGGRHVLCASPERFLSLVGRRATTRPMKGTRPRGATPAADRRLRDALVRSEKDRAELAMIVDLSRNDLGRTCRPGTVRVAVPRRIERYATVFQAVGEVTGTLAAGKSGLDLVRGAFPPGSVTGAPKVEALRVIDALEGEGRGPYCGAIGWLDEGGDLDLAVAIRTLLVSGRRVSYRVGGGVTLLSSPEAERRETLVKGASLARALEERRS